MTSAKTPWPVELRIHRAARRLEILFEGGETFDIPAPLLRAMTPSAADRGHGGGSDGPLPLDFEGVGLNGAESVGAYAVRLKFDDGHDTGIYTWEALHRIGRDKIRLSLEHQRLLKSGKAASI